MDDRAIFAAVRAVRWGNKDSAICPRCGSREVTPHTKKRTAPNIIYLCKTCSRNGRPKLFTTLTGSPMAASKIPLRLWIECAKLIQTDSRVSVRTLSKKFNVNKKTASRVLRTIKNPSNNEFFTTLLNQLALNFSTDSKYPPYLLFSQIRHPLQDPTLGTQASVLALRALGCSSTEISDRVFLSERSVKERLSRFHQLCPTELAPLHAGLPIALATRKALWRVAVENWFRDTLILKTRNIMEWNVLRNHFIESQRDEVIRRYLSSIFPEMQSSPWTEVPDELSVTSSETRGWSFYYTTQVLLYHALKDITYKMPLNSVVKGYIAFNVASAAANLGRWAEVKKYISYIPHTTNDILQKVRSCEIDSLQTWQLFHGGVRLSAVTEHFHSNDERALRIIQSTASKVRNRFPDHISKMFDNRMRSFAVGIKARLQPYDSALDWETKQLNDSLLATDPQSLPAVINNILEVKLLRGDMFGSEELIDIYGSKSRSYDRVYHEAIQCIFALHRGKKEESWHLWNIALKRAAEMGLLNFFPSLLSLGLLIENVGMNTFELGKVYRMMHFVVSHPLTAPILQ